MSEKGKKRKAANPAPKEPKKAKKEEESLVPATGDCTICFEKYDEDYGILKCTHTFCFKCIESWSQQENSCPLCKARFTFIDRVTPSTAAEASSSSSSSNKKNALKPKRVKIKKRDQRQNYVPAGNPFAGGMHLFNLGLIVPQFFGQNMIFNMMNMPQGLFDDDDENDDDYNEDDAMMEHFMHEHDDFDEGEDDEDPILDRVYSLMNRAPSSRGSYGPGHRSRVVGSGSTNQLIDLSADEPTAASSSSRPTSSRGRVMQSHRRTRTVPRTTQAPRQTMPNEVIDLTGDDDEPAPVASSSSAAVPAPAASSDSLAPPPQVSIASSSRPDALTAPQPLFRFARSSSSAPVRLDPPLSVRAASEVASAADRQERIVGPGFSLSSHLTNLAPRGHRPAAQQARVDRVPLIPGSTLREDRDHARELTARRRVLPSSPVDPQPPRNPRGHKAAVSNVRSSGNNRAPVPPLPSTMTTSEALVRALSSGSSSNALAPAAPASSSTRAENPHELWDGFDD